MEFNFLTKSETKISINVKEANAVLSAANTEWDNIYWSHKKSAIAFRSTQDYRKEGTAAIQKEEWAKVKTEIDRQSEIRIGELKQLKITGLCFREFKFCYLTYEDKKKYYSAEEERKARKINNELLKHVGKLKLADIGREMNAKKLEFDGSSYIGFQFTVDQWKIIKKEALLLQKKHKEYLIESENRPVEPNVCWECGSAGKGLDENDYCGC